MQQVIEPSLDDNFQIRLLQHSKKHDSINFP
jgi:hypothetical protein